MTTRAHLEELIPSIYLYYADKAKNERQRAYLGVSSLSDPCLRRLFFSFRWAFSNTFPDRIYRLFDTGKREELRILEEIRACGIKVEGTQLTLAMPELEVLSGHCDGMIETDEGLAILEVKTANDRIFKEIQKKGIRVAKPDHFDQIVSYIGIAKERGMKVAPYALYVVVNKNTDEIYSEIVYFSEQRFKDLVGKAAQIVVAQDVPSVDLMDPKKEPCLWCQHQKFCHTTADNVFPNFNCRTCLHSSCLPDGQWTCVHHNRKLSEEEQLAGCEWHLFLPALLRGEPTNVSEEGISYQSYRGVFTNRRGGEIRKDDMSILREGNFNVDSKT